MRPHHIKLEAMEDSMSEEKLVFSVEEAGKLLSISRATAFARANDGSLPTIRLGRRLLVPKAQLERLLNGEQSSDK